MSYYSPQKPDAQVACAVRLIDDPSAQLRSHVQADTRSLVDRALAAGGELWRDDPLDNMRHVPVLGDGIPNIRRIYCDGKDSGAEQPMPPTMALSICQAIAGVVPTMHPSGVTRHPVYDHLLIPLYLAVVFDPSMSAQKQLGTLARYFPEVVVATNRIISPEGALIAEDPLRPSIQVAHAPEPANPYISAPGTFLRWIMDGLKPLGAEFPHCCEDAVAYMAGMQGTALHLADEARIELERRGYFRDLAEQA